MADAMRKNGDHRDGESFVNMTEANLQQLLQQLSDTQGTLHVQTNVTKHSCFLLLSYKVDWGVQHCEVMQQWCNYHINNPQAFQQQWYAEKQG